MRSHSHLSTLFHPNPHLPNHRQQCVPRLFPNSGKKFQELQAKLDALWREANSAPTKVEPINWDAWRKSIKQTQLVDQLQKEYESKVFPKIEPEVYMTEAQYKQAIAAAEAQAAYYKNLAETLKAKVAQVEKDSAEWPGWSIDKFAARAPGSAAEFEELLNHYEVYLTPDMERALESIDPKQITADLEAGKVPAYPMEALEFFAGSKLFEGTEAKYNEFRAEAGKFQVSLPSIAEQMQAQKAAVQKSK